MKKCPKCGAVNKADATACYTCFESLEGVAVMAASATEAEDSGYVIGQAPKKDAQPMPGMPPAGARPQGGAPYGQPPRPAAVRHRPQPVARKEKKDFDFWGLFVILFTIAGLAAAGWWGWKTFYLPKAPMEVSRQYVNAIVSTDQSGVEPLLSQNSKAFYEAFVNQQRNKGLSTSLNYFHSEGQGFWEKDQWVLKPDKVEPTTARILIQPGDQPIDQFKDETLTGSLKNGYPIILVKEGDVWKVDLVQTFKELGFSK